MPVTGALADSNQSRVIGLSATARVRRILMIAKTVGLPGAVYSRIQCAAAAVRWNSSKSVV